MEIKVGEYVRTKNGIIGTLIEISKAGNGTRYAGEYITDTIISIYTKPHTEVRVKDKEVKSHSKNIIDLIEVGDILKLKDGEKWEVQEHQGDGNWIQTEWEVIENEEDFKNKVDSILTHEQFSSLEYII